ncbi:MAG TPA: PQQ-binding-like beta-propeller repeat protein [Bryobacteraceae bacterium]|nr:PQQ-binding-like beta-propeller repeat protein [Bryobacteraceae bacterium]
MRILAVICMCATTQAASLEWPQFAGPHRNFTSDARGLANAWPASGPKKLWGRDLGEGYSGIAVDGPVLYTMYRRGSDEVTLAAATATGKTIWEYTERAPFRAGMSMENGSGPHATPLVTADSVYTVGILAHLVCLDKKTGKPRWSHDLWGEFHGTPMDRGYSGSPIAWKDTVIMKVGGAGHALMAFNQKDGTVVWQKQDLVNSPSSPVLIQVDGQDQLVAVMSDEIAGLNPDTGDLLWKYPHATSWGLNIALPLWTADHSLYVSSAYNGGCVALELHASNGKTQVKELWNTNRMRVHIGNLMRIGDTLYGSSGDFGPAPLTALDAKTGRLLWQDRSFPKATFIYADGKLIAVDEDGSLSLATVSPAGLKVLSRVALLRSNAWTAPALAGTVLYVRDRHSLMALDLR